MPAAVTADDGSMEVQINIFTSGAVIVCIKRQQTFRLNGSEYCVQYDRRMTRFGRDYFSFFGNIILWYHCCASHDDGVRLIVTQQLTWRCWIKSQICKLCVREDYYEQPSTRGNETRRQWWRGSRLNTLHNGKGSRAITRTQNDRSGFRFKQWTGIFLSV